MIEETPEGEALPLVTVVIPAYNCERYVGRAIRSVLAQTYPRIECIVVDDGSTDRTGEVIDSFGGALRVIRQRNGGAAAARNAGIDAAAGRYIAFLDCDDYWLRTKLALQMEILLRDPDLVLISSGLSWLGTEVDPDYLDATEPVLDVSRLMRFHGLGHLIQDPYLGTPTVVVDATSAKAAGGFDISLTIGEDVDFFFRVCADKPYAILDQTLVRCQLRFGSLTTSPEGYAFNLEILDRLARAYPEFARAHAATIGARRLGIYSEWARALIFRGEGAAAREVLRRSRLEGRLANYPALYLKSLFASVIRGVRRKRRAAR